MSVDILEVGAQIVVEEPGHQALQHLYRGTDITTIVTLFPSSFIFVNASHCTLISLSFLYPPPIKIIKLNGQQLIIKND